MKTIEEAASNYVDNIPNNPSFWDSFIAGVSFAEEWISVDDELPDFDKNKLIRGEQELYLVKMSIGSISCRTTYKVSFLINEYRWNGESDWNCVTHWRPINKR